MSYAEKSYESRLYLAENGYYINPAPFGYSNSNYSLKINRRQAKFVRMMFDWKTENHFSPSLIAFELNRLGVKTKKYHKWTGFSVDHVLHNPVYIGKIRYDGMLFPGKHKPIISEEQFYKINKHVKVD